MTEKSRPDQIAALAPALREAARLLEVRAARKEASVRPPGETELDPEKVMDFLTFFGAK